MVDLDISLAHDCGVTGRFGYTPLIVTIRSPSAERNPAASSARPVGPYLVWPATIVTLSSMAAPPAPTHEHTPPPVITEPGWSVSRGGRQLGEVIICSWSRPAPFCTEPPEWGTLNVTITWLTINYQLDLRRLCQRLEGYTALDPVQHTVHDRSCDKAPGCRDCPGDVRCANTPTSEEALGRRALVKPPSFSAFRAPASLCPETALALQVQQYTPYSP